MSGEPKTQEINNTIISNYKCRIPQRIPSARPRFSPKSKLNELIRPKSANRPHDDLSDSIKMYPESRANRPERERLFPAQKNSAPPINKKTLNEKLHGSSMNKLGRHVITVPVKQKFSSKATNHHKMIDLPDQETIKKCEDLELKYNYSDAGQLCNDLDDLFLDLNEEESITSKSNTVLQLKSIWQEKITQFEGMKNELNDRQNAIMEVYASLRSTKQKLTALGQNANLPFTDDLRVINVANMTPSQLLQLCAETKNQKYDIQQATKNAMTIDMKKLSDMPSKLIATCKQALETRKDFIEWFENLKNQEKFGRHFEDNGHERGRYLLVRIDDGNEFHNLAALKVYEEYINWKSVMEIAGVKHWIDMRNQEDGCSKSILSKKINEFNAENDMLSSSLRNQENEFLKEISDFIRTCWNQTIACQLRNEDLTNELSKLDSLNMELKKQINNFGHQKSYTGKIRVEGLEKELKEEKIKRKAVKDRLTRTEGQIRINEERNTLLESALNEARAQTRVLERTKQQLLEKNQQLQQELNTELNKVNECLKKNTIQLQEIALAKETLQAEKEDLKSKLEELSNHYNESINNMKQELNKKTVNLIDTEKRYNEEMERNNQLQATIESQSSHLEDLNFRCMEAVKKLKEKESELGELLNYKSESEQLKQELDAKNTEMEKYKKHIFEHANAVKELEKQLQEANEQETRLNSDIKNKTDYIRELEIKQHILVQQSQENESKIEIYEEQLLTLKNHIIKLKEHFGEFEDLNDLNESIKQQNSILNDTRRKNSKLLREVEEKKETLKHLTDTIDKQEKTIKEKQNILHMISEKQTEQKNTVQLNEQIDKKNAEIETLINNIESKKEQIEQLEKILLTLEDENHKAFIQQQRDQNKIYALEKRIIYYEHCNVHRNSNIPSDDLDCIIKILEHELETQDESELITTDRNYNNTRPNENIGDCHKHNFRQTFFQIENDNTATKKTVGNFIDRNKISNKKYKIENLGRKQAITKIDTQKWTPNINSKSSFPSVSLIDNERVHKEEHRSIEKFRLPKEKLRNIQYFELNQARDQKKDKMFKFASHQL